MADHTQKAAEYRRLALDARACVEPNTLANVREKHELAAARWDNLADQTERAIATHLARLRVAPIRRSAGSDHPKRETCELDSPIPDGG